LNDQEKIKALNNVENSATKFENFNILKDAVRLEQYDPYMTRYPYVLNRYTPEQHDWVINNIGKDVYKLKNNSGGVTSPTLLKLILSLEQDNPEHLNQALVSFYLANKDDESFEKSLQWLTAMPNYNHKMLFGIIAMTIISQAVRREKLDMLKNYIPESLIYDPTLNPTKPLLYCVRYSHTFPSHLGR
jgi:hypothetical protein